MYSFEVHYYVNGVGSQLVTVIQASNRQDAERAVKAMYNGNVTIHLVVRV